jgi:hypothetical protein
MRLLMVAVAASFQSEGVVGKLKKSCRATGLEVVLRGVSVSLGRGVDVGDMLVTDRRLGDSSW